jgi:hypothetical protein
VKKLPDLKYLSLTGAAGRCVRSFLPRHCDANMIDLWVFPQTDFNDPGWQGWGIPPI